jgi:hypothetical protein
MDWLMVGWVYWSALGCSPAPWGWCEDEPVPASGAITAADLWLIELAYEVVAAESRCTRCGAPLGRGLRVMPWAAGQSPWTVSMVTSCGGWRRHRHVATVGETSNDLVLGPFRTT